MIRKSAVQADMGSSVAFNEFPDRMLLMELIPVLVVFGGRTPGRVLARSAAVWVDPGPGTLMRGCSQQLAVLCPGHSMPGLVR